MSEDGEEIPDPEPYRDRIRCPVCDGGTSATCAWLICDLCLGKGYITPHRIKCIWMELSEYHRDDR